VQTGDEGVAHEQPAPPRTEIGNLDTQLEYVAFHPAGEIFGGTFLDGGDANELAKKVVAIEFDERVEIHQDHCNAGDEHDFIGKVVNRTSRWRAPPDDAGDGAKHKLSPDSSDDGSDARPLASVDVNFANIAKEGGRKIHQHETHLMDGAAEVLAGEAMGAFVEEPQATKQ